MRGQRNNRRAGWGIAVADPGVYQGACRGAFLVLSAFAILLCAVRYGRYGAKLLSELSSARVCFVFLPV